MKKIIYSVLAVGIAIGLISWGRTGHNVIGLIAANHLTDKARAGVSALLGNESLADVASWADETRDRTTASWHFINVEPGLSFDYFKKQVASKVDVYTVLIKEEGILADGNASREDRVNALKYVVHFVGDMHQPMHVSRAEDKGGNTIQLQYDGQAMNLHSLWDMKLLEHAGLSDDRLAQIFDKATPKQIKKWQSDSPMIWAWESYQISTQLYAGVDKSGNNFDNAYYKAHMPIVENRIEKAGIRLAGVLNEIFAKTTVTSGPAAPKETTALVKETDLANYIGQFIKVKSKVYGHKDFGSVVLVNMGAAYPGALFTIVLRGDAKGLADNIDGQTIWVTGKVTDYRGKPEVEVKDKNQIEAN